MDRFTVDYDPAAIDDLAAIRDHMAAASGAPRATSVIERAFDHIDGFGTAPRRGSVRDDIRPGLRVVGWRRILTIAFIVDDQRRRVVILGVLYRGRDMETVLQRRAAAMKPVP